MTADSAIHHSIMAIDIESASSRDNGAQIALHEDLYTVAQAAAYDAALSWEQFGTQDEGDSVLMYIPASVPPVRLAGTYLRTMNERLAERARRTSAPFAMRWRVVLHHGLVSHGPRGWTHDTINHAARLLDAQPLRAALKAAPRAHLAFMVSDDVFQAVIKHPHRTIDRAAYRRVRFDVKTDTDLVGWVYVPGYSTPPGLEPYADDAEASMHSRTADHAVGGAGAGGSESPLGVSYNQHNAGAGVQIHQINQTTQNGDNVGVKNVYEDGWRHRA